MNDCDCCDGTGVETPAQISNRPGLRAIAYRIGTHSRFKGTMLARLSGIGLPALRDLKTRADDDFSIALLDAWATVADVLTFYQERIANEAYLRTATERRSLVELARLIGYKPRPGVAANAYLAFTMDTAPGSPAQTTVDIGTRAQSVPGPDEKPQTFETIEKIEARADWNAMKPRLKLPQTLATGMDSILFKGTGTQLARGDAILIVAANSSGGLDKAMRRVSSVAVDNDKQQTTVALQPQPGFNIGFASAVSLGAGAFVSKNLAFNNTTIQNTILSKTWNQSDLESFAIQQGFNLSELYQNIAVQHIAFKLPPDTGVFALRKRAALFGHIAPDWNAMSSSTRSRYGGGNEWPVQNPTAANVIWLDAIYKEIKKDDWVVVVRGALSIVARVTAVQETALSRYALSAQVTQLTLDTSSGLHPTSMNGLRQTAVYVQSEELEIDELPDTTPVQKNSITLNKGYEGLKAGQSIIVAGKRSDLAGVSAAEAAELAEVTVAGGLSVLSLVSDLENSYVRESISINANVALATNGETTRETLGGGDASKSYAQYPLKQTPLTYISAATASGAESTLQVYVNDVQWNEKESLYGAGARDHIFVTRTDDDGTTTVQFGDGTSGARPPTGQENIKAVYRKGIGKEGNVKAGQISLLLSRPLGVKDVINPAAANGGAERETTATARSNAPVTVLTLGRIVSLRDYEDFARAFAGIAKALGTWTWDGQTRGVFVTVAGADGAEVKKDSTAYQNLLAAMMDAGDPYVPLRVETYQKALFRFDATVKIDSDYQQDKVLAAVEQKLRPAFSFDARTFGQAVTLSELIALIQNTPGVVAVDMNALYRTGESAALNARLAAAAPRAGSTGEVSAAELLTLDPRPLELGEG